MRLSRILPRSWQRQHEERNGPIRAAHSSLLPIGIVPDAASSIPLMGYRYPIEYQLLKLIWVPGALQ